MLDLKNRAVVYEHMDIILDESYVIPLSILRRFVAGSSRGHVSICGDVVGPSFPKGVSIHVFTHTYLQHFYLQSSVMIYCEFSILLVVNQLEDNSIFCNPCNYDISDKLVCCQIQI